MEKGIVAYSWLDLSLRWHYPAASGDAATPRGGQVLRVGARKRLLSSSTRSSAGLSQCTPRAPGRPSDVSHAQASVHALLWILWISIFCHARRFTNGVDKTLTAATRLNTKHILSWSIEVACEQALRHSSEVRPAVVGTAYAQSGPSCPAVPRPPPHETVLSTTPANWACPRRGDWALSTYREHPVDNFGDCAAKGLFAELRYRLRWAPGLWYTLRPYGVVPR